jgi:hypothetical protein
VTSGPPITWQGNVVGYISEVSGDMFDLFGAWTTGTGTATELFLERLRSGEQLWVEVGTGDSPTRGTVEEEPLSQINIRMHSIPRTNH